MDLGTETSLAVVPYHFGQYWGKLLDDNDPKPPWNRIVNPALGQRLRTLAWLKPSVCVSGDCMAALACHRPDLALMWLDAHGDFHTPATSLTCSIGGMPLAMMCGLGPQDWMRLAGCDPLPARVVYHYGGSAFDPGEEERMADWGLHVGSLPAGYVPIHLHIDTDVINSHEMPGQVHPSAGGLVLSDFFDTIRRLRYQTEVLSIKTPSPELDTTGRGRAIVRDILREFDVTV